MQRGKVQTLHVVKRKRCVDQEAEQTGTNQIPERHRDEKHQGPFITRHPRCCLAMRPGFVSFDTNQGQRHHFKRRERGTECNHRGGRAGKIQMMEGAKNAARHKDNGGEQDIYRRRFSAHQTQLHE